MKIFNAAQLKHADEATVILQGITYYDLMERAGHEAFKWITDKYPDKETLFYIYCGTGNNGGDGMIIARMLHENGYLVLVKIIEGNKQSNDYTTALLKAKEADVNFITDVTEQPSRRIVIIDALVGTGLSREPQGDFLEAINHINNSGLGVISIDVPSGLFLDRKTDIAVHCDYVLTFQLTKLSFYLPENYKFIKYVEILGIGLDAGFVDKADTNYYFTDKQAAVKRYKPVPRYAHKGTQGHALIIAGSYGKTGAALLCTKAAIKSGCGLVTTFIPECGYIVLQTGLPEAMVLTGGKNYIEKINFELMPKAIAIGPGLGQHEATQKAFYDFLKLNTIPLVIDADALNILSYNKEWLKLVPKNSILTPHPKELQRLIGNWQDDFDKIEKIKEFSKHYNIIIVAKDAHTLVCYKDEVHINASGNPALATGGSGDVLTGIITGLAAQGYNILSAAIFGVYLHGLTADIGIAGTGMQSFTASSLIDYLGKGFLNIESERI